MIDVVKLRQQAGRRAADTVQSGMIVGLGTGRTAKYAVERIAERLKSNELENVLGIPTSKQTETLAIELGIPLTTLNENSVIDVTIDGADEVDPDMNVIKGGGGALLREKIVAQASERLIIVVDDAKLSLILGSIYPLPVEVISFGHAVHVPFLRALGSNPVLRMTDDGEPFKTDSGNFIYDCKFDLIGDAESLAYALGTRAGIVEHGMFIELATDLIVSSSGGIEHRIR